MPEAGHGRHLNTPSDTVPKTHSVEEMVLLVGGRAGGLHAGQAHRDRAARTRASA